MTTCRRNIRTVSTWAGICSNAPVDVDVVTGATVSSQALIDAVEDALIAARFNRTQVDNQQGIETIFDELEGKTFTLSSGVGNWYATITFDVDGLFQGNYYDLNMGEVGDGYPNGTCYLSSFNGTMGNVEQINSDTFSMEVVDLFLDALANEGEITDGIRYVEADFDIEYGDEFMLYLPGRSTADLPEEFLSWVSMPLAWTEIPPTLPVYGLYCLRNGNGFFSSDG